MSVIFPLPQSEKKIDVKFLVKKKAAAKVLYTMVAKVHALYYVAVLRVQVSCTRQIAKQKFSQNFQQRQNYKKWMLIKTCRSLMKR